MIMWRFRIIVSLAYILLASSVFAQPPLTITSNGYYITVLGADGVPSLVKLTVVVDLTGGTKPDAPKTPEPPEDNVDLEVVKQIKAWADAVADPQGAQGIAAVYSHAKGAVDDDTLNTTTIWPVLNQATDAAVIVMDGGTKWKEFRGKLSALITEGRQRGTLQSKASVALLTRSVQQGLELSADGSNALSLDLLTRIAMRTNEAIDEHK